MKRIVFLLLLLAPLAGCSVNEPDRILVAAPPGAVIAVKGMHCEMCASSVKGFLKKLPGVETVQVDVASGIVRVTFAPGAGADDDALKKAVYDAGFEATEIRRR